MNLIIRSLGRTKGSLLIKSLLFLGAGLLFYGVSAGAETGEAVKQNVHGITGAFEVTSTVLSESSGVQRIRIAFPSPEDTPYIENNTVIGELYLPQNRSQALPVVLLHILNGNFEAEKLVCAELAQKGTPAFWFKLPYYGERRPKEFQTSRPITTEVLFQMLEQGFADFQRACDFINQYAPSTYNQVNLAGISMGGILSYDFAYREPRVNTIATVMAGGDLWGIIQHARETRALSHAFGDLDEAQSREAREKLWQHDPLHAAEALKSRGEAGKILMINAVNDEVIPRENAEKLAQALNIGGNLIWLENVGHYTIIARIHEVIDHLSRFLTVSIGEQVKDSGKNEALLQKELSGEELMKNFSFRLAGILDPLTPVNTPQSLQLQVYWENEKGETEEGAFSLKRNPDHRFILEFARSDSDRILIGQNAFPWLYLGKNHLLLVGNQEPNTEGWMAEVGQFAALRIQLLTNLFKYGVRVPGILKEQGNFSEQREGSIRKVSFTSKKRIAFSMVVEFDEEAGAYRSCTFQFAGQTLKWDIQQMELNVSFEEEAFASPQASNTLSVRTKDLQHTLSLLLEVLASRITL